MNFVKSASKPLIKRYISLRQSLEQRYRQRVMIYISYPKDEESSFKDGKNMGLSFFEVIRQGTGKPVEMTICTTCTRRDCTPVTDL